MPRWEWLDLLVWSLLRLLSESTDMIRFIFWPPQSSCPTFFSSCKPFCSCMILLSYNYFILSISCWCFSLISSIFCEMKEFDRNSSSSLRMKCSECFFSGIVEAQEMSAWKGYSSERSEECWECIREWDWMRGWDFWVTLLRFKKKEVLRLFCEVSSSLSRDKFSNSAFLSLSVFNSPSLSIS